MLEIIQFYWKVTSVWMFVIFPRNQFFKIWDTSLDFSKLCLMVNSREGNEAIWGFNTDLFRKTSSLLTARKKHTTERESPVSGSGRSWPSRRWYLGGRKSIFCKHVEKRKRSPRNNFDQNEQLRTLGHTVNNLLFVYIYAKCSKWLRVFYLYTYV